LLAKFPTKGEKNLQRKYENEQRVESTSEEEKEDFYCREKESDRKAPSGEMPFLFRNTCNSKPFLTLERERTSCVARDSDLLPEGKT